MNIPNNNSCELIKLDNNICELIKPINKQINNFMNPLSDNTKINYIPPVTSTGIQGFSTNTGPLGPVDPTVNVVLFYQTYQTNKYITPFLSHDVIFSILLSTKNDKYYKFCETNKILPSERSSFDSYISSSVYTYIDYMELNLNNYSSLGKHFITCNISLSLNLNKINCTRLQYHYDIKKRFEYKCSISMHEFEGFHFLDVIPVQNNDNISLMVFFKEIPIV
jgi:hypothetical protein